MTLEQMPNALTFAGEHPRREDASWEGSRSGCAIVWEAAPIKAFCDVTLLQTKVIPELRKRMPVGHL